MHNLVAIILSLTPFATALLAQVDTDSIARYGVLGVVLAWFMVRMEKRLVAIEHKMVGLNKTMLIEIFSRPTTSDRAKKMCNEELKKLDPRWNEELGD